MDKGTRVGVLMGGMSTERPVSLKSGKAVLSALQERGWDAVGIEVPQVDDRGNGWIECTFALLMHPLSMPE